jgi:hypothetical protein
MCLKNKFFQKIYLLNKTVSIPTSYKHKIPKLYSYMHTTVPKVLECR